MSLTRRQWMASAASLLLAPVPAHAAGGVAVTEGPAFGAGWRLVTAPMPEGGALRRRIEAAITAVDRTMSPFRADSDLTRFNRTADTDWQPLPAGVCTVVREALRVAALTSGAFDPTVGPLVGRYGFGPIHGRADGRAGEIAAGDGAVRKARPDLTLDLCGIAKGYALDLAAAACEVEGVSDYLIEIGGEVRARGRHPAGRPWQAGIERPLPGAAEVQRVLGVDGVAFATSGNAVNAYRYKGHGYAHIIDPATRRPADTPLASVTVAAYRGMTADALATALFAMGLERGQAFAEAAGIEALFLIAEGGGISERATGGFERRILA